MRNNFKKIFLFGSMALFSLLLLSYKFMHAATPVTATYPAFTQAGSPAEFVGQLYLYALGIAGTLAIIMIVYGGIKYIVGAGNTSAQGDAKDIITSAVWGIVLLAGAYLVLSTINPDIVKLENPGLSAVSPVSSANDGGTPPNNLLSGWTQGTVSDAQARQVLDTAGIGFKQECPPPPGEACAELDGLQKSTVAALVNLKQQCDAAEASSCNVFINEGTGGSHSETSQFSHANGYKADLKYEEGSPLAEHIQNLPSMPPSSQGYDRFIDTSNQTYSIVYMHETNPPHWDVAVIPKPGQGK